MMRTKDEHIDYLEDEVQYLEGRKEELKEKVRNLEDRKNDLQNQLKNKNSIIENLKRRADDLNKKIEELNSEKNNKDVAINNLMEIINDELDPAKKEVAKLEEINKQKCSQILMLDEEVKGLNYKLKKLLNCDVCGETFESAESLQDHHHEHHVNYRRTLREKKKVKCCVCGKPFHNKDDLQRHKIFKHKESYSKESLLRKMENLHEINMEASKMLYKNILKIKEKEHEFSTTCFCKGVCYINHSKFRWIPSKSNKLLNTLHSINDKAEDTYDWAQCDFTFKNAVQLKTHTETVHKIKQSLKILKCDQCNSKFKLPADLKNHVKDIHQFKPLKSILKKL